MHIRVLILDRAWSSLHFHYTGEVTQVKTTKEAETPLIWQVMRTTFVAFFLQTFTIALALAYMFHLGLQHTLLEVVVFSCLLSFHM